MSTIEEHCKESLLLFGKNFARVHSWLDEFAGKHPYGMRHRKLRHHEDGIQAVIVLFGIEAGPVARQHIESDLREEGWKPNDPFPKNEKDYIRIGFF